MNLGSSGEYDNQGTIRVDRLYKGQSESNASYFIFHFNLQVKEMKISLKEATTLLNTLSPLNEVYHHYDLQVMSLPLMWQALVLSPVRSIFWLNFFQSFSSSIRQMSGNLRHIRPLVSFGHHNHPKPYYRRRRSLASVVLHTWPSLNKLYHTPQNNMINPYSVKGLGDRLYATLHKLPGEVGYSFCLFLKS